jgi:hypothetical protein
MGILDLAGIDSGLWDRWLGLARILKLCHHLGKMLKLAAILEMTSVSHSSCDHILWMLANNGGKMERSRLRESTDMRYALQNPILEELARDGKIKITIGEHGELISQRE